MPTAEDVLTVARSQIGTVEDHNGNQKYGAFYGMNGVAWCAEFQWWCFNQVPGGSALIPKTAYTPTFYQWFVSRRQSSASPVAGDLVFYNWPDSINRVQHVGIVESVESASIVTIEGNTSSGVAGSQSNGGGVWRRRRARNSSIVGFGRPLYAAAAAPTAEPTPRRDIVIDNREVTGEGVLRLICPVGKASAMTGEAWVSVAVNGPGQGSVRGWFQNDAGGVPGRDFAWTISFNDGHSERPWVEFPDGATQINLQYNLPDGGVICLEANPK